MSASSSYEIPRDKGTGSQSPTGLFEKLEDRFDATIRSLQVTTRGLGQFSRDEGYDTTRKSQ